MKKYSYFDGLLVVHPLISARYSSLTTSEKNSKHSSSPPLKQAKHTQAVISTIQSTPEKKPNLSARFYATEKNRPIPGWQVEDLTLLKIINTYALRPWNNYRSNRKIIRPEN